jgi:hypothetical protein
MFKASKMRSTQEDLDSFTYQDVVFVTHADRHFTSRAIALIKSLMAWNIEFQIIVVCHDNIIEKAIRDLKIIGVETVLIQSLESIFPELLIAQSNRTRKEYFFCLTPFVIEYANRRYRRNVTVYLDADIYFFDNPMSTIRIISKRNSVTIVPHRFSDKNSELVRFGIYNVGWIAFTFKSRRNEVLEWWMKKCLESTSISKSQSSVYGDQKYLEDFGQISDEVGVDCLPSHNVAPWNVEEFLKANPDTLPTYYHFSGLRKTSLFFTSILVNYHVDNRAWIHRNIYKPYLRSILKIEKRLKLRGVAVKNELTWKSILQNFLRRDLHLVLRVNRELLPQRNKVNLLVE